MKRDLFRTYSMMDVDLAMFASNLTIPMTRDLAQFTLRGVTALEISALGTKATDFFAFPPDEYYVAQTMLVAQTKNALRSSLEIKIRDVVQIAITKYGHGAPEVKNYNASDLTHESDKSFVSTSKLCVLNATAQLSDLSPLGLTQAMIDAIEDDGTLFLTELNNLYTAELLRSSKAVERIEKGNELYALVTKYCDMGKFMWDDVDKQKYESYVIYSYPPGVPGKILNMAFLPSTNTVSWNGELTADSYELQYAPNSPTPSWSQIYAGTATEYRHDGVSGISLYRCRGINENGNGYWSDVLTVLR
jgi:hypothetical protein